ncbi:AAA family ATPase [Patescibacteria group bacterium]|nr:AAA family ATPase [Patescibacteria group bacterium]
MKDDLSLTSAIAKLQKKVETVNLPPPLLQKIEDLFSQLNVNVQSPQTFWQTYQSISQYLDWVVSLPWFHQSQDILDLAFAKEKLDQHHYGLESIKQRILEYISVLILQKNRHSEQNFPAPVFLFVGLVGTGKTTLAKSVASVLGRQFIRIPFGGLGDPLYLRGRSRVYPEAEPGAIIKGLKNVQTKNPVILLDEIDRIADDALNTIMGVLVELLDSEQNARFVDHYLDYPFDLSQVIFCATCNNTAKIATAVLDRLEIIEMPSYNDEEKITIGRDYLLPQALKMAGLSPTELQISPSVWPSIVRPLGFDAGVRTLKRNVESLCRQTAHLILQKKLEKVTVDETNVKQFIPQW